MSSSKTATEATNTQHRFAYVNSITSREARTWELQLFGAFIGFGRVRQKRAVSKASATTIWLLRGRGEGYRWFQKKYPSDRFRGKKILTRIYLGKRCPTLEKISFMAGKLKRIHPKPNHAYPLPSKVKWSNENEIKWKSTLPCGICLFCLVFKRGCVTALSSSYCYYTPQKLKLTLAKN